MKWTLALLIGALVLTVIPAAAATTITAATGQDSYAPGQALSISGLLPNYPGTPVTLSLVNGGGQVTAVSQTTADSGGRFAAVFVVPPAATPGRWAVDVSAAGTSSMSYFSVTPADPTTVGAASRQLVGDGIIVDLISGELINWRLTPSLRVPPADARALLTPVWAFGPELPAVGAAPAKPRPVQVSLRVGDVQPGALVSYYDEVVSSWIAVPTRYEHDQALAQLPHFAAVTVMQRIGIKPLHDMNDHWAHGDVLRLQSLGVVAGYPDETYRPERVIQRAEFVKMLLVAAGLQPTADETWLARFTDAGEIAEWARPYVAAAGKAGLLATLPGGTFEAEALVTRLEAATALALLLTDEPAALSFSDVDALTPVQRTALGKTVAAGIIKGFEDGTFRPDATLTRAQLAAVIARAIWHRAE